MFRSRFFLIHAAFQSEVRCYHGLKQVLKIAKELYKMRLPKPSGETSDGAVYWDVSPSVSVERFGEKVRIMSGSIAEYLDPEEACRLGDVLYSAASVAKKNVGQSGT